MQNKRMMLLIMVVAAVLVLGHGYWTNYLRHKHPNWFEPEKKQIAGSDSSAGSPTAPAGTQATTSSSQTPAGIVAATQASSARIGYHTFDGNTPKEKKSLFVLGLNLDAKGASISGVVLNQFRQRVDKNEPYSFQHAYEGISSPLARPFATESIVIDGAATPVGDVNWELVSTGKSSAIYAVNLKLSGGGLLTVRKIYTLRMRTDPGDGYEIGLRHEIVNGGTSPVKVKIVMAGPTVPKPENDRETIEVVAGFESGNVTIKEVEHAATAGFKPEKEPYDVLAQKKGQELMWAGVATAYFDAIIRPVVEKAPAFASVTAKALATRTEGNQDFAAMRFETAEQTIAAGQSGAVVMEVFLGPKQRELIKGSYYSVFPRMYDQTLVLTSGICAKCTFQWLIDILVGMLQLFHKAFSDWGLAIIALVIVVRLLLHPVTKKSQVSMSKMAKMGPEMEKLKKKHGDNKEELNKAMMQFYREQGVSPFLGCLPMFLQMPIWIALWSSLQSTFELRHAPFLWGWTWIHDLSQPDRLIAFAPVSLWFFKLDGLNILPICLGVVFYIQQKMTPKPEQMTPEQAQQHKMMQWMSLLFPIFLYSGPSGLNLYIMTSTGIGIIESKRIRDHLKAKERAEKEGKVFVETKATKASKRLMKDGETEAKPGCLAGWLLKVQQMAEDVRKQGDPKKKKRD